MPILFHRTQPWLILCLIAVLGLPLSAATVWAAEPPPAVRHPNLLLNREEIE